MTTLTTTTSGEAGPAQGVYAAGNVVIHKREDIRRPLFMRKKRRRFRDLDADANHVEPWKLTLLEAYHLIAEDVLHVARPGDPDRSVTLSKQEAWNLFANSPSFSSPRRFAVMYAAYRHLRKQNWVIKMGQTYGGHFAIYQGDPDFFHSQFCVLIRDDADDAWPWIDVTREMRVANQTGKELMLCEVRNLGNIEEAGTCADVEFSIMLRWVLQHEQVGKERAPHRKLVQKLVDPAQKVARRKKVKFDKQAKKRQGAIERQGASQVHEDATPVPEPPR
ncbi:tRNA-splicing endonuclease subunit Sen2 [Hondaea fermentalgiana]|uniref:tRNA-intron lyase n=1 Tax=Hondaea fermentalgiana TaxID=2315210 RepID=A0A2R5GSK8_9STRA|nr:tRNA-splicing endonuclease subunit Sen2 [Hondaea fermentalgiana]|eukprot:GBG31633.1 tRNA-splicing endonuclease subunit Sen2 [Hondaea fermentalgiana]